MGSMKGALLHQFPQNRTASDSAPASGSKPKLTGHPGEGDTGATRQPEPEWETPTEQVTCFSWMTCDDGDFLRVFPQHVGGVGIG